MRIIGGHDYFDSALAFGVDKTVVFKRSKIDKVDLHLREDSDLVFPKESSVRLVSKGGRSFTSDNFRLDDSYYSFSVFTVWFAGKRYGMVRVAEKSGFSALDHGILHFWEHDKFIDFLNGLGLRPEKANGFSFDRYLDAETLKNHFDNRGTKKEVDWLIEKRISIAISARGGRWNSPQLLKSGWLLNTDGLSDLEFAKVLDPYSAFQELSMWVGGVLPKDGPPMVEITDEKTKLQKHGMDKWSFRRMPSK